MAFSVNAPVGDGTTKQFAVNFTNGLFSRDSVHVFVEGEVDGTGEPIERSFTWLSDGLIELIGDAPASGATVEIRRIMEKDQPAVDYEDGEILTEETMDRSLDHLLNTIHELLDGYGFASLQAPINMNGHRITNLAPATAGSDAVTQQQISALITASSEGSIISTIDIETFTATQGQTRFTLQFFEYILGVNALQVYKNGLYQVAGDDYTEDSNTAILFTAALNAGDEVVITGARYDSSVGAIAAAQSATAASGYATASQNYSIDAEQFALAASNSASSASTSAGTATTQANRAEQEANRAASEATAAASSAGTATTQADRAETYVDAVRTALNVNMAGGTDVTLTDPSAASSLINLTGTLTANVALVVPDTARKYTIVNSTSGAFTVTVKTAAGTGEPVPQGQARVLLSDGVDVVDVIEVNADQVLYSGSVLTATDAGAALDELSTANNAGTKAALNAGGAAPIYSCRGFVSFNGADASPTIFSSGNVSSVIKDASGIYTINFISDMPDTNFIVCGSGTKADNAPNEDPGVVSPSRVPSPFSLGSAQIATTTNGSPAGTLQGLPITTVAFFR